MYYFDSKDLVTNDLPHMCFQTTWTGTQGAVGEAMPQKSGAIPSEEERKKLKVVPPAKLQTFK